MEVAEKSRFVTVIDGLEHFAENIASEDRTAAQETINAMSANIAVLSAMADKKVAEFNQKISDISNEVGCIIQNEADVRQNSILIQNKIATLNVTICSQMVNQQQLIGHINQVMQDINNAQRELCSHKAKLDELNNKSAESIFRSIICFGLDRAIMGITSLVENDTGRINSLNQEIQRFQGQLLSDDEAMRQAKNILQSLNEQKASSEKLVASLDAREKELHAIIESERRKEGFFLNVALFYGKLAGFIHQIDHRLDDIVDLVNGLDDPQETIVDIDNTNEGLISLKDALIRFEDMANSSPEK